MREESSIPSDREAPALVVRPWVATDAPALRAAIDEDVEHIRPWLSWSREEPATLERTAARIETWVEDFRAGRVHRFAITSPERQHEILGGVWLGQRVGPHARDLGYWIRRSATRQGIAGAAAAAMVNLAFDDPDTERVIVRCDVANDRSAALARALGFAFLDAVTITYPDGSPRPALEFEMTREKWHADHAPAFRARARNVIIAEIPPPPATEPGSS